MSFVPKPTEGEQHWQRLLASEYARCVNLVANCDAELSKTRASLAEWEKERRKWAERAIAISAHLGGEVTMPPPRHQSELTEAWEFDAR